MTPELEVLDQLEGGDLPLDVVAGLFSDLQHCRRATVAMLQDGKIIILDPSEEPVPPWRFREFELSDEFWAAGSGYRMSLSDEGLRFLTCGEA